MTLNALVVYLEKLRVDGYGEYKIIDDGYGNEIKQENIMIDDINKEIVL